MDHHQQNGLFDLDKSLSLRINNLIEMIAKDRKDFRERIEKLEKDFESKLDVDYKKWIEYYSLIPSKNKKPHKCPVCEGKPNLPLQFRDKNNEHIEFIADCHACEGKGIVWG